jgi:hypothetical protein
MIDLKELEKEIDALLSRETPESLRKWFETNKPKMPCVEAYFGDGKYGELETIKSSFSPNSRTSINRISINDIADCNDSIESVYQFAA